jgi:hypothetical protein
MKNVESSPIGICLESSTTTDGSLAEESVLKYAGRRIQLYAQAYYSRLMVTNRDEKIFVSVLCVFR